MCGIAGFIDCKQRLGGQATDVLGLMTQSLTHRGPDHAGAWLEPQAGVALGHRRLSILDLSPTGHQPMRSHSGRYTMVYNGEIYNVGKLRGGLDVPWRGHSDTEVMLAAFDAWGIEKALQSFNGMFALAVWDEKECVLILARDRIGEKPLYYADTPEHFLFASELKAIKKYPLWKGEIDREALGLLVKYNYIPAPYSIYKGVKKLMPGHYLTVKPGEPAKLHTYWSASQMVQDGLANPLALSDKELVETFDRALKEAVGLRMIADVPLGAFLSGGVDSSAVVALMQAQSVTPVKTYTIGFQQSDYNEAEHAKAVAAHLATDHTELYVTEEEARRVIPKLPSLYDEPFADASQIPTFLVSEMTRRHVTVALTGDAGDELFGGYNRYRIAGLWQKIALMPAPLRKAAAAMLQSVPVGMYDLLPIAQASIGEKAHKFAGAMGAGSLEALYDRLVSFWDMRDVVIGAEGAYPYGVARGNYPESMEPAQWMMASDLVTYLPNDILAKVDRTSMGVSLETRVPLLDTEVMKLAWQLPLESKIRDGRSKWLLRQVLYQYVPPALIERPKMGFGVPIRDWLRGPLRGWAESLLDETRLIREGYFHPAPVHRLWREHLSGKKNWQYHLWSVLMFQSWLQEQ
jgi:asparagine synthase (glutamine-hydrolysing)